MTNIPKLLQTLIRVSTSLSVGISIALIMSLILPKELILLQLLIGFLALLINLRLTYVKPYWYFGYTRVDKIKKFQDTLERNNYDSKIIYEWLQKKEINIEEFNNFLEQREQWMKKKIKS